MNKKTYQLMLSFLLPYRWMLLLAFLAAVFAVVLNVYAPLLIGNILDQMVVAFSWKTIKTMMLQLILLYLLYSLFAWVMLLLSNQVSFSLGSNIRKKLFHKMNVLPISYFDTHVQGDLISRFVNDVDLVSEGLMHSIATLLQGIVTIFAAIIFMAQINFKMTGIVILCAPFTYFVAKFITLKNQHYFTEQAREVGTLNGYIDEMISQIRSVKNFHQEKNVYEAFQKHNQQLYECGVRAQFFGSLVNPSTRLVTNLGYAIVGFFAVLLGMRGEITVGDISAFLIYSNLFSKPFNEITAVLTQLQQAVASALRIVNVLEEKEEKECHPQSLYKCKGQITFHDVSFSYDHHKPLIEHLNLDIPSGTNVAIVGKTGAGKTTLVNLLMRFYDVCEGSILLDEKDIRDFNRDTLRSCFGMVLQDTYLFDGSIADNIAYGKKDATRTEIMEAAKKSGAHLFIRKLEKGYDTQIKANHNLSEGQKQLLSLTRVLLVNPAIMILDEATSSIDTRSERQIAQVMDLLMKNKTSFIIAHRLSTITSADLILMMDQGKIIEMGTHEQLMSAKKAYYELYHSQFQ